MKKTVTYKGNIFTYTLHDCRGEGNGEKGYIAFVDLFKGCVTSTPNNNFRQLEKMVRSAIKEWLEVTKPDVEQLQEFERLKKLVRSHDYFYKAMADNISDKWIEKGFKEWWYDNNANQHLCNKPYFDCGTAFGAGIKYALKSQVDSE